MTSAQVVIKHLKYVAFPISASHKNLSTNSCLCHFYTAFIIININIFMILEINLV